MKQYVLARLVHIPATLLLVSLAIFLALRLTGDPVNLYLPFEAPDEQRAAMRIDLGLDQPLAIQYLRFVGRALSGDLGFSLRHNRPAIDVALEHLPATLLLAVTSFTLAAAIGGALGIWAAIKRGGWVDRLILSTSFVTLAVPGFWVAILSIYLFSVLLRVLPTSGSDSWRHLVLPAVSTAWVIFPRIALLVRSSLLGVMGEDYVRTARAKGLAEHKVVLRHMLRNGCIPVMTYMGLLLGRLMGGVVITETVFGWPGLGSLAVEATFRRDMGMVQTTALLFALVMLLLNLVVDALTAVIDPRVRT